MGTTKTQISQRIRTVRSDSSLSVWRNFAPLAIQKTPNEDSEQIRRLIWIFAGRTWSFKVNFWTYSGSLFSVVLCRECYNYKEDPHVRHCDQGCCGNKYEEFCCDVTLQIIGCAIGGVVAIAVLIAVAYYCYRKKSKPSQHIGLFGRFGMRPHLAGVRPENHGLYLSLNIQKSNIWTLNLVSWVKMSADDILKYFSQKIKSDISCKLSKETVCMKSKTLLSKGKRESINLPRVPKLKHGFFPPKSLDTTVEPQWLEHLWDQGNSFEAWVVRATECNHGTSSGSK